MRRAVSTESDRLVTGDETGLLKLVNVAAGDTRLVSTSYSQNRQSAIAALALASPQGEQPQFYTARKNGDLETWEQVTESFDDDSFELAASSPGLVGECIGLSAIASSGAVSLRQARLVISSGLNGVAAGDKSTFDVEGSVSAFDRFKELIAVGGREHELSIWNLDTNERQWRARNVPNDKLDMRRPVWVGAVRFITDHTLLIGTKYKQLRIYDSRAQRRPVSEVDNVTEHAVRQLLLRSHETALVADIAGAVLSFDLRQLRLLARHVGPAGSIRGLARHPTVDTLFAAVGLDRELILSCACSSKLDAGHCHVWDVSRREKTPVSSIYCKQRLNAVLWLPTNLEDNSMLLEDDKTKNEIN